MKQLKIGIIGAGRIGSLHAKSITYNVPTATVVGITDVFKANAEKVAAELNIPKIYDDYKQMLADRQLDFIVSLGDLCKPVAENRKVLEKFNSLGVPFYPVIGNHETDEFDLSAITEFYSLNAPYYSVSHDNYKLIFMNTCYLTENGTEKSYYKRNFKHSASPICIQVYLTICRYFII